LRTFEPAPPRKSGLAYVFGTGSDDKHRNEQVGVGHG
jgi:hypothetical protein